MTTRYGGHQYEFLSTRMEDRDRCFAIDTQPNDHTFLVRYVDQNTIRNQETERQTTYLSNHQYVPDLNKPVALVQNGCSEEGQDNATLLRSTHVVNEAALVQNGSCVEGLDNAISSRSTQVVEEATLVSNGCSVEGQENATFMRSTEVVNEAALVLNGSCVEGDQDNAISSRSAEVVEEATLVSNACSVEGQDNATLMRSTEVVNEAALVQNGSCVEGQDNATLSRSTEVVKKATLAQDGRCMESEDNTTSFRSVEVVKEAALEQNECCIEGEDNATPSRTVDQVVKEAALVQNECCVEGEDNATPSRSVDHVVKESALVQNECCVEGEDNATPSRSVDQMVKEAALVQNECCVEVEDATLSRSVEVIVVEDDEANASEPIEAADKEQFRQNPNTRKENPCVMIRIGKDYFNQETSCGRQNLCKSVAPLKRKARIIDVDEGDHGIIKRAFVRIDNRQLSRRLMRPGNDRLAIQYHNKVQILVPIYDEANKMTKEKVYDYQNQDVGVESSEKHDVKEEHDHHSIRTHQCSGCSVRFKKKSGRHHEEGGGEGSEMTHSVEILDIAPLVEKGFVSPFVSSKKFHTTMVDEESPEEEGRGGPTASDVFKEEVLRIFRTPFNYEEYKELREAIKAGNYLAHHQDVKRKLKTFRHKRGKCLNILRGFFYWLQNLTREGSFQPWTDRQCLAVEPPRS